MPQLHVLGLMSGTSMDGIDAVLVRLEQHDDILHLQLLGHHYQPYSTELLDTLHRFVAEQHASLQDLCIAHYAVGRELASASLSLRRQHLNVDVDLIACHGQTIWHQPRPEAQRSTWQLGTPACLVAATGITVVHDFRARDISEGGQGAPLVPFLDCLLFEHPTKARVLLNIGGIANVTCVPASNASIQQPVAFDIGPGNALIDAVISLATNARHTYDVDGQLAAQGTVNEVVMQLFREHPSFGYFTLPAPKSTGKETFGIELARHFLHLCQRQGLDDIADQLATITAFTADAIAASIQQCIATPLDEIIASGGGTRNLTLMNRLAQQLPNCKLTTSDTHGLPSQQKEALAFAVLGYMTIHGWPSNIPACTGARQAVVLGSITPGANYLELMQRAASSTLRPPRHAQLNP